MYMIVLECVLILTPLYCVCVCVCMCTGTGGGGSGGSGGGGGGDRSTVGKVLDCKIDGMTITLGDCAENEIGMEIIGTPAKCGLTCGELKCISSHLTLQGVEHELIDLRQLLPTLEQQSAEPASMIFLRNGIDSLYGSGTADLLFEEAKAQKYDKHKYSVKHKNQDSTGLGMGVVNSRVRYNNTIADDGQDADIVNLKGTIVPFSDTPYLSALRGSLGDKLQNDKLHHRQGGGMVAETNVYFDIGKCGIGGHGDKERKVVSALVYGASRLYQIGWFQKFKLVGKPLQITMGHGDLYILSEKAVGQDWKMSSKLTLRHAAGANIKKYMENFKGDAVPAVIGGGSSSGGSGGSSKDFAPAPSPAGE